MELAFPSDLTAKAMHALHRDAYLSENGDVAETIDNSWKKVHLQLMQR